MSQYPRARPLAEHAIVITGASDGIGAELARQLATQGARLALGARRAHELDEVAQQCIARGGRSIVVPTDVTDPAQCERLVARTVEAYGKVDVMINNAGIGSHVLFADITDLTIFERLMRVNYLGSVYCTHFALPELKKARGRLVAMSSLAGKTGVPSRSAYAASKHAMQGFFESLRIELEPTGVSVTILNPGFVQSNIRINALGGDGAALGASHLNEREVMTTEECARQCVHAIESRQRELVMRKMWKLAAIAKVIAPEVVDGMAARTITQSP